jgi:hypothetical protein
MGRKSKRFLALSAASKLGWERRKVRQAAAGQSAQEQVIQEAVGSGPDTAEVGDQASGAIAETALTEIQNETAAVQEPTQGAAPVEAAAQETLVTEAASEPAEAQ